MIPTPEQMIQASIEQTTPSSRDDVYNSPEVMSHRQQTCFSCEYYDSDSMKCNQCWCPVIMMSQFNFKECPKGYW